MATKTIELSKRTIEKGRPINKVLLSLEGKLLDKAIVQKMISEGKARPVKNDERVMRFIASSERVDRDGDILRQNWDLEAFQKNPVILWNHDQSMPIGRSIREEVVDDSNDDYVKTIGKHLVIYVEWMDESHGKYIEPLFAAFKDGFLKAGSVGYVPVEYDEVYDEAVRKELGLGSAGVLFNKCELAEFTLCTVPSNRDALSTEMKTWNSELSAKVKALVEEATKPVEVDIKALPTEEDAGDFTLWEQAKESINTLLGEVRELVPENYEGDINSLWKEIDGDFGVPTLSDVTDFVSLVEAFSEKLAEYNEIDPNSDAYQSLEDVIQALQNYASSTDKSIEPQKKLKSTKSDLPPTDDIEATDINTVDPSIASAIETLEDLIAELATVTDISQVHDLHADLTAAIEALESAVGIEETDAEEASEEPARPPLTASKEPKKKSRKGAGQDWETEEVHQIVMELMDYQNELVDAGTHTDDFTNAATAAIEAISEYEDAYEYAARETAMQECVSALEELQGLVESVGLERGDERISQLIARVNRLPLEPMPKTATPQPKRIVPVRKSAPYANLLSQIARNFKS